jgi:hypothetical protein
LSQGDDVYALPVNFNFQPIYFIVMSEHLARRFAITLSQCKHCAIERSLGFAAQ